MSQGVCSSFIGGVGGVVVGIFCCQIYIGNETFDMSQGGVHHLWVGVVGVVGGVVVGWIE